MNGLELLRKKRKTSAAAATERSSSGKLEGSKKKALLEKLTKKYNKQEVDPENEDFEDYKQIQMEDDDEVSDNQVSTLRSLDESLTKGAYKGHTIRKEDLFEDANDLQDIQEDYLREIKRMQQLDDDSDKTDEEEEEDEDSDDIQRQIQSLVEDEDIVGNDSLKKTQDVEKQKASSVLNQKLLYDHLLKFRILLQKPLAACNRLPQNETFWDFVELADEVVSSKPKATSEESSSETIEDEEKKPVTIPTQVAEIRKDLFHLMGDFLTLQSELVERGMMKHSKKIDGFYLQDQVNNNDDDGEDLVDRVWNVIEESNQSIETFRNESIERWALKTKIQSSVNGGGSSKLNLKVINAGLIQQIESSLKNEKERKKLIGRTQLKQFEGSVLGKRERDIHYNDNGYEIDSEIFDDKDFYQVLLKDLISEVGGSSSEISFRRALTKKKQKNGYDGKTKGKAIKYTVHNELVNFMAPNWEDEIPESATTLFANLFGGGTVEMEEEEPEEEKEDATMENEDAASSSDSDDE